MFGTDWTCSRALDDDDDAFPRASSSRSLHSSLSLNNDGGGFDGEGQAGRNEEEREAQAAGRKGGASGIPKPSHGIWIIWFWLPVLLIFALAF